MMNANPRAARITQTCLEAAAAVACCDNDRAEWLVYELISMTPGGHALRLAASAWAAVVADHIVTTKGPGSFSATIDNPDDEASEIFAAVVCAIGNRDAKGAFGLMRDSEPAAFQRAAMQLLGAAGAALAAAGGVTPGGA